MASSSPLPLIKLARQLASKQSELAEARQAYDARLKELANRQKELQKELGQVEAELEALSSPESAPAAKAPASKSSSSKAPASKTSPSKAPSTKAPPKNPATESGPNLTDVILGIVKKQNGPISVKDLTKSVFASGFETASKNPTKTVSKRVAALIERGLLARAPRNMGVLLGSTESTKKSASGAATKSSSPKKEKAPAKSGTNGSSVKPSGSENAVSLSQVLLDLLSKNSGPVRVKDLAQQALEAGYESTSKDFPSVVSGALGKLPEAERVEGKGYRLKRAKAKK